MQDFKIFVVVFLATILFTAVMVTAGAYGIKQPRCYAQFDDAAVEVRWSFWGGCQVRDPKQGWIPSDNFRVL